MGDISKADGEGNESPNTLSRFERVIQFLESSREWQNLTILQEINECLVRKWEITISEYAPQTTINFTKESSFGDPGVTRSTVDKMWRTRWLFTLYRKYKALFSGGLQTAIESLWAELWEMFAWEQIKKHVAASVARTLIINSEDQAKKWKNQSRVVWSLLELRGEDQRELFLKAYSQYPSQWEVFLASVKGDTLSNIIEKKDLSMIQFLLSNIDDDEKIRRLCWFCKDDNFRVLLRRLDPIKLCKLISGLDNNSLQILFTSGFDFLEVIINQTYNIENLIFFINRNIRDSKARNFMRSMVVSAYFPTIISSINMEFFQNFYDKLENVSEFEEYLGKIGSDWVPAFSAFLKDKESAQKAAKRINARKKIGTFLSLI